MVCSITCYFVVQCITCLMLCKNESHDNGRGQYISCVVLFIGCDGCMTSKSQKLVLPHKKNKYR